MTMNKDRKSKLYKLTNELEEIKSKLEEIQSEEQEYNDNIPDNLRDSERAQASDDAVSNLDNAMTDLESIIDGLTEIWQ